MQNRVIIRPARWLALGLFLSAALAARGAAPEILNQVPGDAYGVIVVSNVRAVSNKVSNAATRLSLPLPPDLVGAMTRSVGITAGFDANGAVALVLLKPPPARAGAAYFDGLPPAVLMVPTTNASLMLEKFNPTAPDKDGISQVALPDAPDIAGFAVTVDKKWVVLAQKREDLMTYLGRGDSFAKTAGADALKVFDANDLVIWANVEKLGAGVDKWLEDQHARVGGMSDLTNFIDKQDVLASAIQKHGVRMVFDVARQFFKDAGASMLAVRLTDSGATLGVIADFRADTPMGRFVAAQAGGPDGMSLAGLPAGNYLAAGAAQWNAQAVSGVAGDMMDRMAADPVLAKDARLAELKKSFADTRQALALVQGMRALVLEPAAGAKEGLFSGAFLLDTSDPKKFIDLEMQLARGTLAQQGMNPDLKTSVTVEPNFVAFKDVPLVKMTMKYSLREETPDKPVSAMARQELETIRRLYGAEGVSVYMGVVGKRVLMIYGNDLQLASAAVAAAQSGADVLGTTPEITATKEQIVDRPIAVAYLPITRWVSLAQSLAQPGVGGGGGGGAPTTAPSAPPVVMSLGVTGKMITAEVHVPIQTIIVTQEAFQRMDVRPGGVLPVLP